MKRKLRNIHILSRNTIMCIEYTQKMYKSNVKMKKKTKRKANENEKKKNKNDFSF